MLEQLRYVRLPSSTAAITTAFARDIVGLEVAEANAGFARFRSDERAYTLEYDSSGATTVPVVGIEVRTPAILDAILSDLIDRGLAGARLDQETCRLRRVSDAITFTDYSGNALEIVVRPQNKGRRSFPSRDAGIVSFSGVALRTTNLEHDAALWQDVLKAEVRDYVGRSVYLGFDSHHHRIALHPSETAGILSISFEVENLNNIMQGHYYLSDRQIKIVNGPGREPFSGKIFISFEGPDGIVFTYGTDMSKIGNDWRPRQYSEARESFCSWGSPVLIPELSGREL